MSWTDTYDAVFFITILTIITGSIAVAFKYCLRSKCENFSCCFGALAFNRRVELEVQEELELGHLRRQDSLESPNPHNNATINIKT
jgi:hypothetical protein